MSYTTDRSDECLTEIEPSGMQKCYLVLSEEDRAQGFVRPLRRSYTHLQCGSSTRMGLPLCETYARDPSFYGGTFCANCGEHFRLRTHGRNGAVKIQPMEDREDWGYAFTWNEDGSGVGS